MYDHKLHNSLRESVRYENQIESFYFGDSHLKVQDVADLLDEIERRDHLIEDGLKVAQQNLSLQSQAKELQSQSSWVKVSDRLPADYAQVLFYDDASVGVAYGHHVKSVPKWVTEGGFYYHDNYKDITHWQPLPQPPSEVKE